MAYLGALVLAAAVASEGVPTSTALRGQDHQVRELVELSRTRSSDWSHGRDEFHLV